MNTIDLSPLISTIIISYNHASFTPQALESVKAQTYKSTQLIIVDDCSSDDSVEVIERWLRERAVQCTFIRHQRNLGICRSLNDALKVAQGKYISLLASDDLWLPDKLTNQVDIMESQPEAGVLYSDAFQIDEHGVPLAEMFIASHLAAAKRTFTEMPQGQIQMLSALAEGNFIPGMTTLVRRSCFDAVGSFDESLIWEDWDMWMRIARHYSFLYSPVPSAKYRVHQKSASHVDRSQMLGVCFETALKHVRLGGLTDDQKNALTRMVWSTATQLYEQNDKRASDTFSALWQALGSRRALWMHRFAKAGISCRNWQRAEDWRLRVWRVANLFKPHT